MIPRVLFISPRVEDADQLRDMLDLLPVAFDYARGLEQARAKLREQRYRVILTEAALPDAAWLDVLELARENCPDTAVIVTDPLADGRFWAEALNRGAYDLIAQPFHTSEVQRILSNACSRILSRDAVVATV